MQLSIQKYIHGIIQKAASVTRSHCCSGYQMLRESFALLSHDPGTSLHTKISMEQTQVTHRIHREVPDADAPDVMKRCLQSSAINRKGSGRY